MVKLRNTLVRLLACTLLAVGGPLLFASRADAQSVVQCNLTANTPIAGFGGVGGSGSALCWDFIDPGTQFIMVVKLWRRDANGVYHEEARASNFCVAGANNNGICAVEQTLAFRPHAPQGTYHTQVLVAAIAPLSCPGCSWQLNSGTFVK
jgi:hypothetical protein